MTSIRHGAGRRLSVAIIGGGAAGMATAWLLDEAHDVTLFEASPALGGHVRTLNGNVPCPRLPADLRIDCGVIEFERDSMPVFLALLGELDVAVETIDGGTTALYFADGRHYRSPHAVAVEPGVTAQLRQMASLLPMALRMRRFLRRARNVTPADMYDATVTEFLDDSALSVWLKALLSYAYSTDFDDVDRMPAALAVPTLRRYVRARGWLRVPGGVYRYLERLREELRGEVLESTPIAAVGREAPGVVVTPRDGPERRFDKVVFATSPEQVLRLLVDPTEDECFRFGGWTGGRATTVVHTDTGLYDRRGVHYYSEFDLLETPSGRHGYNAYLNRLCGVPGDVHYSLAFQLEEEIDPRAVIHRQEHQVPRYTVEALRPRREVIAHNGERDTLFAGAWLGDGLHEGAIRSATAVSRILGGKTLASAPAEPAP